MLQVERNNINGLILSIPRKDYSLLSEDIKSRIRKFFSFSAIKKAWVLKNKSYLPQAEQLANQLQPSFKGGGEITNNSKNMKDNKFGKTTTMYYKIKTIDFDKYLLFLKGLKEYANKVKVFSAGIGEEYLIVTGMYDKNAAMHPEISSDDFDNYISSNKNIQSYKRLSSKPNPESRWQGKWVSINERIKKIEFVLSDDEELSVKDNNTKQSNDMKDMINSAKGITIEIDEEKLNNLLHFDNFYLAEPRINKGFYFKKGNLLVVAFNENESHNDNYKQAVNQEIILTNVTNAKEKQDLIDAYVNGEYKKINSIDDVRNLIDKDTRFMIFSHDNLIGTNKQTNDMKDNKTQDAPTTKEAWEMTQVEFYHDKSIKLEKEIDKGNNDNEKPLFHYSVVVPYLNERGDTKMIFSSIEKTQGNTVNVMNKLHKKIIQQALSDNKPVSEEVLKDYPELKENKETTIQTFGTYKLGDKYSSDFDEQGLFETAKNSNLNWGAENLEKLYNSFEDNNYHEPISPLWKAITLLKEGKKDEAQVKFNEFQDKLATFVRKWKGDLTREEWEEEVASYLAMNGVDSTSDAQSMMEANEIYINMAWDEKLSPEVTGEKLLTPDETKLPYEDALIESVRESEEKFSKTMKVIELAEQKYKEKWGVDLATTPKYLLSGERKADYSRFLEEAEQELYPNETNYKRTPISEMKTELLNKIKEAIQVSEQAGGKRPEVLEVEKLIAEYFEEVVKEDFSAIKDLYEVTEGKKKYVPNVNLELTETSLRNDNTLDTNIWNLIPDSYKKIKKVKQIAYKLDHEDKGLKQITSQFIANDELRPIMNAVHFNDKGVACTDAHKLLFLAGKPKQHGNYCVHTGCFNTIEESENWKTNEQGEIVSENPKLEAPRYPNYETVIPDPIDMETKLIIDSESILLFTETVKKAKLYNPASELLIFTYGESKIGFKASFLQISLETMKKLGHDKVEMYIQNTSRAVIFCGLGNGDKVKSLETNFVLLMPMMVSDSKITFKGEPMFDLATESVFSNEVGDPISLTPETIEKQEIEKTIESKVKNVKSELDKKLEDEKQARIKAEIDAENERLEKEKLLQEKRDKQEKERLEREAEEERLRILKEEEERAETKSKKVRSKEVSKSLKEEVLKERQMQLRLRNENKLKILRVKTKLKNKQNEKSKSKSKKK